jgi:succinyl-diaminopimelate desuccinylase
MKSELDCCLEVLASQRETVISLQTELTARQGLGPDNGGEGEAAKAAFIEELLHSYAVPEITHVDAPDARVSTGVRPNIVARIPGKSKRTLWLFGHMDVVPTGDLSLWSGNPWQVRVTDALGKEDPTGDWLIGRGVEDNQQAIVSALLLAHALHHTQATPELGLGMVFMADEETGNAYGMDYILATRPDLFAPDDLYIIPDAGSATGVAIEVAEKGMLWLKFTVTGKQCHASTPHKGINACVASAALTLALATLPQRFPQQNELFKPACSTFAPTRHDANVPNINTIPGKEVLYLDCRIIPGLTKQDVLEAINEICTTVQAQYQVHIEHEVVLDHPAEPVTALDSPVVLGLIQAARAEYGIEPQAVGIGGGTVAAALRHLGYAAVAWSRIENTCHSPDERARISSAIGDARTFARMLFAHE